MKIICYLNKINDGGADRAMSVLAGELPRRGHCVTMVTDYSQPNDYPLDEAVERVILDGQYKGRSRKWRINRTIRRICKQKGADILISFIEDANSRAPLATRGLKTKNLISPSAQTPTSFCKAG